MGVLEEMGVSADMLAAEEDKGEEEFWQFLEGITGAAVAARQGKGEEREKLLTHLDEFLKELPEVGQKRDSPETVDRSQYPHVTNW